MHIVPKLTVEHRGGLAIFVHPAGLFSLIKKRWHDRICVSDSLSHFLSHAFIQLALVEVQMADSSFYENVSGRISLN
jgi:hypothetical protein